MIADRARRGRLTSRARVRVPGRRGLAVIGVIVAVLVAGFFWLRESSLVAIQEVTITGVAGPDATQIRSALRESAESMTTMAVSRGTLERAVARYPVVRGLTVSTHFPHGLSIDVAEEVPVAVIVADGMRTEVSANGTLLRRATAGASLPTITAALAPTGSRVGGAARAEVELLADAPYALLARIATASTDRTLGLTVTLRDGPAIYFGAATALAAKWHAATLALAAPDSAGADYIDVTDPNRPAAGTGSDGASAMPAGSSAGAASTTTSTTVTSSETP